jgi:type VI secretion system protein ImpE
MSGRAEAALRAGDLGAALRGVLDDVRASPAAIGPRMALFQLAGVVGDWTRAKHQLDAIAQLDPEAAMMAEAYGALIDAEAVRRAVFAGRERPVCLGEPPAFVAMLAEALGLDAQGQGAAAGTLREHALEAAEPVAGTLDGTPFAWIMDADTRLGPVLEAIVNGRYRWVPFDRLQRVESAPPADLKDLVWLPVRLMLANGAEAAGFVPTRYPGSEVREDDAIRLARRTEWRQLDGGSWIGLGQRMLATDQGEHALLDVRMIELRPPPAAGHG